MTARTATGLALSQPYGKFRGRAAAIARGVDPLALQDDCKVGVWFIFGLYDRCDMTRKTAEYMNLAPSLQTL